MIENLLLGQYKILVKERTGINVVHVEIRRIDFLRDTANLRIFYYEDDTK